MKKIIFLLVYFLPIFYGYAESNTEIDTKFLTINIALERAIALNSSFKALTKQKDISEALIKEAKQTPIPNLKIGIDEFAGSGEFKGNSSMKSIIGIEKAFESKRKRKKRIASAETYRNMELLKIQIAKKELKLKVASIFFRLYQLSKELEIQKRSVIIAEETAQTVNKKVLAGELAKIDATRAYVEFTREETIKKHLELDLTSVKNEMASLWNSKDFLFQELRVENEFYTKESFKAPDSINPKEIHEIALAEAEVEHSEIDYKMAKLEKKPDLEFSLTYSKYKATSDRALGIEATIPLIGKSLEGKIEATKANIVASQHLREAIYSDFFAKLNTVYMEKESLKKEVLNLESMLLPAANQAFSEAKIAFDNGEKGLLELFDASKALLETEKLHLELQCKLFNAISEYAILSNQL